jgi:hypothetical protein
MSSDPTMSARLSCSRRSASVLDQRRARRRERAGRQAGRRLQGPHAVGFSMVLLAPIATWLILVVPGWL